MFRILETLSNIIEPYIAHFIILHPVIFGLIIMLPKNTYIVVEALLTAGAHQIHMVTMTRFVTEYVYICI